VLAHARMEQTLELGAWSGLKCIRELQALVFLRSGYVICSSLLCDITYATAVIVRMSPKPNSWDLAGCQTTTTDAESV
jgi:hypothetical protein